MPGSFSELFELGLTTPFSGWDLRWLEARCEYAELPWNYRAEVSSRAATARAMLDMGTGGGEFLSGLAPLPRRTAATECWPPNAAIAAGRLHPLGIPVVQAASAPDNMAAAGSGPPFAGSLPFTAGAFDLVINRHESFNAAEVARVLTAGGTFVTQQVDYHCYDDLYRLLGLDPPARPASWLPLARRQAGDAGLAVRVAVGGEQVQYFSDVAALVYYLRIIAADVPGVQPVSALRPRLRSAFENKSGWPVPVRQPHFLLVAVSE